MPFKCCNKASITYTRTYACFFAFLELRKRIKPTRSRVDCAGEGLGSDKSGRADPVAAGNVKLNNLGVGAQQPGEVTAEDDIYEQYKKRMMLGYRYRPNPLVMPNSRLIF